MTDTELLLAISNMLDSKLKSELQPFKNELTRELQTIRSELAGELQYIRSELAGELQDIRSELAGELQDIRSELQTLKNDQQSLRAEVHSIKLYQENIILPRLATIEACYIDTYNRYKDYTDKMDATFEDIALLKQVVAEHSEKIQKLA
ncbi:MAG: DUF342 domain-containing protein [Lachnospiraceae bacterium]|nr:DUF342 domain-containing protein [Lachnospiraceae bacterium]